MSKHVIIEIPARAVWSTLRHGNPFESRISKMHIIKFTARLNCKVTTCDISSEISPTWNGEIIEELISWGSLFRKSIRFAFRMHLISCGQKASIPTLTTASFQNRSRNCNVRNGYNVTVFCVGMFRNASKLKSIEAHSMLLHCNRRQTVHNFHNSSLDSSTYDGKASLCGMPNVCMLCTLLE